MVRPAPIFVFLEKKKRKESVRNIPATHEYKVNVRKRILIFLLKRSIMQAGYICVQYTKYVSQIQRNYTKIYLPP